MNPCFFIYIIFQIILKHKTNFKPKNKRVLVFYHNTFNNTAIQWQTTLNLWIYALYYGFSMGLVHMFHVCLFIFFSIFAGELHCTKFHPMVAIMAMKYWFKLIFSLHKHIFLCISALILAGHNYLFPAHNLATLIGLENIYLSRKSVLSLAKWKKSSKKVLILTEVPWMRAKSKDWRLRVFIRCVFMKWRVAVVVLSL